MVTLPPVLVIGAGVIGLSVAVTLAEAGYPVVVRTAEPSEATTSAVAGALWGPWLVEPRHRVLRWAEHTLTTLHTLAAHRGTGVRLAAGIDVSDLPHDPHDWAHLLPDRRPCTRKELPAGYVYGTHCTVPLVDMPTYLTYLTHRLIVSGGAIQIEPVASLDDVARSSPRPPRRTATHPPPHPRRPPTAPQRRDHRPQLRPRRSRRQPLLGLRHRDHQPDQHRNIHTPVSRSMQPRACHVDC